ncbi:MAG: hypothetical protein RL247_293 [Actinomycetota bacterium]
MQDRATRLCQAFEHEELGGATVDSPPMSQDVQDGGLWAENFGALNKCGYVVSKVNLPGTPLLSQNG